MNKIEISIQELKELLMGVKVDCGEINISENMNLFDDLGISSFDMLIAICEIEKKFNIVLPINECNSITTIKDLYDYIISEAKERKNE